MRKWNFCSGPAVISEEVLSEVQSEMLEYKDIGASIMEISHRSKIYTKVAPNLFRFQDAFENSIFCKDLMLDFL